MLEKLLPCLKTPDERLVLHGLELLHQVASLLGQSVEVADLWEDSSAPAREMVGGVTVSDPQLLRSRMVLVFTALPKLHRGI